MHRKYYRLFIFFVALLVLSVAVAIPSDVSARTRTVDAYGDLEARMAGMSIFTTLPPITIRLRANQNPAFYRGRVVPYDETLKVGWTVLNKGFKFKDVPANGQPMLFTLTFETMDGKEVTYSAAYKFNCGYKRCGNMGDFTLDVIRGTIRVDD